MSVQYPFYGVDHNPNLEWIASSVASSDMTNKSLEYSNYMSDSSSIEVYFETTLNASDQTALSQIVTSSYGLVGVKEMKKVSLDEQGNDLVNVLYANDWHSMNSLYTDAGRYRPNRKAYLQNYMDWIASVEVEVANKCTLVDDQTSIEGVDSILLDATGLVSSAPSVTAYGSVGISDDTSLSTFLDANEVVTDASTGISGPYWIMELLNHRKDLYNDSTNPLYDPNHTPILGQDGILVEDATRIENLEVIHGKLGWHSQEVQEGLYKTPKDLLIYYGWPNSFNSAENQWNNELVAQDMAAYDQVVLGAGVEDPSHGDYANTLVIIPRVKLLNPSTKIYGYVTVNQAYGDFTGKVDQWGAIGGVDGIFLDEAGYDYGKTRSEFNERVDYIHDRTDMNECFANAWHTNHILGTSNDPSYPNSTFNDTSAESHLEETDWILLESFPINTDSTSFPGGYENASIWAGRGSIMQPLRAEYGVNFAACGIINNDNTQGNELFKFGYLSSLMWSLDSYGTSDSLYASSSAAVTRWTRPCIADTGPLWNLNSSVQMDGIDSSTFHRYAPNLKMTLDFNAGQQDSTYGKIDTKVVFGGIYTAGGSTAMTGLGTSPTKVTTWATDGFSMDVTADSANNRIVVKQCGIYTATASFSFTGSNNTSYTFRLYQNGAAVAGFSAAESCSGTEIRGCSFNNFVQVKSGDVMEIYIEANAANKAMTLVEGQFTMQKICG